MKLYIESGRLRQCEDEMLLYAEYMGQMQRELERLADDMGRMSSVSQMVRSLKMAAERMGQRKDSFNRMSDLLHAVCECYRKAEEEISGNQYDNAWEVAEEADIWKMNSLPEPISFAAVPPVCLEHLEWLHFV